MKKFIAVALCLCTLSIALIGCGKQQLLDSENPTELTMWHVFGSQTESPMNTMVDEFNKTVGKEQGVIINVTSISNSSDIHDDLLAAAKGDAGAGDMPDIFFCYPETAGAIGADRLVEWDKAFTDTELAEYIPSFIEEGRVEGKLLVFPVAKSSEALFVNATIFDRFAADCGVTYADLATWEGLFEAAEEYYDWSDGQTFVMHDELLNYCQINTTALGGSAFSGDQLNFNDPIFRAQWENLAGAAISGHLRVEDNYETTLMMTGDIVAGIGSTASIMYFQDTVTYRDNTTEPLVIKALPCPVTKEGDKMAMQQGAGLAAINGDEKKEAAALLFAQWISQGETNLRFVTQSGYMPVQSAAFDAIQDYEFKSDAYKSLYEAMDTMSDTYQFYLPPVVNGYYDILWTFYENSITVLNDSRNKFESGNETADALVAQSYESMRQAIQ
ncbi:ABC transporter substrate-binding protein [Christensenellaceae bacterium OttesenSCG-928-K19]|nr:ABC transporter substrate-binding protein [Christensenellaceae bacterium OttesenSCG-928-K19]